MHMCIFTFVWTSFEQKCLLHNLSSSLKAFFKSFTLVLDVNIQFVYQLRICIAGNSPFSCTITRPSFCLILCFSFFGLVISFFTWWYFWSLFGSSTAFPGHFEAYLGASSRGYTTTASLHNTTECSTVTGNW